MLKRLYIDNFRCFEDFTFEPERLQFIAGENGSGKSSLFDALVKLRAFLVHGWQTEGLFKRAERARWLDQLEQDFQLRVEGNGGTYDYGLTIDHSPEAVGEKPCWVSKEVLLFTPHGQERFNLLSMAGEEVQLFRNDGTQSARYPVSPKLTTSKVWDAPGDRSEYSRLSWFRDWIGRMFCGQINPFYNWLPNGSHVGMRPWSDKEDPNLAQQMTNFVSWYHHVSHDKERDGIYIESLRAVLPGLTTLWLPPVNGTVHVLKARFAAPHMSGGHVDYGFDELSEGQRCLICLYALIHFLGRDGALICLDEPDNFVSLREIQPLIYETRDRAYAGDCQILLASHHPDIINELANDSGVVMYRDPAGRVQFKQFNDAVTPPLTPSEAVARGWINE